MPQPRLLGEMVSLDVPFMAFHLGSQESVPIVIARALLDRAIENCRPGLVPPSCGGKRLNSESEKIGTRRRLLTIHLLILYQCTLFGTSSQ
jgi:hypothetical protein